MIDAIRRLFGATTATCANCFSSVTEQKRQPCPKCGEVARIHARYVTELNQLNDKARRS